MNQFKDLAQDTETKMNTITSKIANRKKIKIKELENAKSLRTTGIQASDFYYKNKK